MVVQLRLDATSNVGHVKHQHFHPSCLQLQGTGINKCEASTKDHSLNCTVCSWLMQPRIFDPAGQFRISCGSVRFPRQTQHCSRQRFDAHVLCSRNAHTRFLQQHLYMHTFKIIAQHVLAMFTGPFPGMMRKSVEHLVSVCPIHIIEPGILVTHNELMGSVSAGLASCLCNCLDCIQSTRTLAMTSRRVPKWSKCMPWPYYGRAQLAGANNITVHFIRTVGTKQLGGSRWPVHTPHNYHQTPCCEKCLNMSLSYGFGQLHQVGTFCSQASVKKNSASVVAIDDPPMGSIVLVRDATAETAPCSSLAHITVGPRPGS